MWNVVRAQRWGDPPRPPFYEELMLDEDRGLLFDWTEADDDSDSPNNQLFVYNIMHNY